ncbi:helix-turn-helix transcriptional regulator [Archangium sp.]|uniref:helix-turn-helix domain-containing protein n=1 Tax=Archangium sp. TaxID=1872627 RepID=UPI002D2FFDE5|nr:helix-turn-helix transcriptional regulator [Archangium sp.]HYO54790.1 helix-turn-helix transcriptional regulator [Archangium sp.]
MFSMDIELQRTLGEVAREARERLGLTQAQVAHKVGLVPGVYGRIERGDMTPSVPSLRRICLVLGISSDALLNLKPTQVAGRGDEAPSNKNLSPELRRVVHQLLSWSPKRLKVLSTVLTVIATVED